MALAQIVGFDLGRFLQTIHLAGVFGATLPFAWRLRDQRLGGREALAVLSRCLEVASGGAPRSHGTPLLAIGATSEGGNGPGASRKGNQLDGL